MRDMRRRSAVVFAVLLLLAGIATAWQSNPNSSANTPQTSSGEPSEPALSSLTPQATDHMVREIRHELIMLPYYSLWDNLAFRIDGHTVTLEGQVVRPTLKSDAENVVKRVEGVEKVVNNIEVLPPSPMDNRIRMALYRAIYGYGPLFKYANMVVPSIHIIVKNGRVTLEGVVDSEADKNAAGLRANTVPGTFQVTNNLRVVPTSASTEKKKK